MCTDDFSWWQPIQGFCQELDIKPNLRPEDGSEYINNSYTYRSEEFTTTHKDKHVLFSGCSATYGVGLKQKEVWAYRVYNQINKTESCSGYFNIGVGGNNIVNSILNIFKYCKKFGNPNVIFINLPSHLRSFDFDEEIMVYKIIKYNDFNKNYQRDKLTIYNYYFMLEQYCKTNNIKLFSFTWSLNEDSYFNKNKKIVTESTNDIFKKYDFETFYFIEEEVLLNRLFIIKQQHDNDFFDIARDNKHLGNGIHRYWAEFIYDKYLEKQN
jgi:hypothetical protein